MSREGRELEAEQEEKEFQARLVLVAAALTGLAPRFGKMGTGAPDIAAWAVGLADAALKEMNRRKP